MARNYISENTDTLYRAVITVTYESTGRSVTHVYGPYTAQGPATAQITSAENRARASHGKYRSLDNAHTATGRVEVAHVVWQRPI